MNNLGRLLLITFVLAFNAFGRAESATELAAGGDDVAKAMFLSMALDSVPEKSRLGARSINRQFATNEELCDVIAELLLQGKRLETDRAWIDTIAWYGIVIRDAHNPRYTDVLQQSRQLYTNLKILKQIDAALASIAMADNLANSAENRPSAPPAQYKPGNVDLAKKRAELQQMLRAHVKLDRTAFSQIGFGSNLNQVVEKLGVPDDFSLMTIPVAKWGRASMLAAHYAKAGLLILKFDRAVAQQWVVVEPIDEPFDVKVGYSGSQFGLAQTLSSLRGQAFRLYLKLNSRAFRNDAALLSILGERLIQLPYPADKYEADGMEIAMKLVAQSKDPASTDLLRRIAATSGSKVPRMAQNYLKHREKLAATGGVTQDDEKEVADEEENESADSSDGEDPSP